MRLIRSLVYLLDDGPEVLAGGRGDHAGKEDARPSSSKGKGDGHAKSDEKVEKSDLARRLKSTRPEDGYAFHWMPGKLPFMVTPKQGFVHLQIKDDIPYLVSPK